MVLRISKLICVVFAVFWSAPTWLGAEKTFKDVSSENIKSLLPFVKIEFSGGGERFWVRTRVNMPAHRSERIWALIRVGDADKTIMYGQMADGDDGPFRFDYNVAISAGYVEHSFVELRIWDREQGLQFSGYRIHLASFLKEYKRTWDLD